MLASRLLRPAAGAQRQLYGSGAASNARYQGYYRGRTRYNGFQQASGIFQRWAARPTFYYEVAGSGAFVGGCILYNTEVVPVSGRRRFNIISNETEAEMGKQEYEKMMQQLGPAILPRWDSRVRQVQRVLNRLIPVTGLEDSKWEVHVINNPTVNAFVIPGGKVFVFAGMLKVCDGDDALASVLGHEIGHAIAHHAAERASKSPLPMAIGLAIEYVFPTGGIGMRLADWALSKRWSRSQEVLIMSQACYDPSAAVRQLEKMQQMGQAEPPEFLSTHPSHQNRAAKIVEWLPEAEDKRAMSDCSATLGYADEFKKNFGSIIW